MDGNIRLKYIEELINEKIEFAVPDYQRGYKWTTENINELLNDIITLKDGEEYCLMPIIVRPTKNDHGKDVIEIVDGQQRLTTLRLLIDAICNDDQQCKYSIPEECYNELDIKNKENAVNTIKSFGKRPELKGKLLPTAGKKHSPFYFIWYEINGTPIDAVNTFNRVNSWKIPLKESELAKAHIFSAFGPDNYAERRMANIKWTNLEKLFNNPNFFSFFTIGKSKDQLIEYESAHMDLLLEIWANILDEDREAQRYPIYKKITENKIDGATLLVQLEKVANAMKFIHEDRVSYHLASYLLLRKRISVADMVDFYMEGNRHGIKDLLAKVETEQFFERNDGKLCINIESIEKLSYWNKSSDYIIQKDILTLYNICDSLANNTYHEFYPTVLHSSQNWTLEHIHAKSERSKTENEIKSIIELLYKRFTAEKERNWLDDQEKAFKDDIDSFYAKILYPLLSGVNIDDIRPDINSDDIDEPWYETSIMNLALLPYKENSSFNNSTYLEKIEKLKSFDLSSYIPKCTLQCFSKEAFSDSDESNEFWTKKKGERYLQTIISTITECLNNLESLELTAIDFESESLKTTNHTGQMITEENVEVGSGTISNETYSLRKLSNIFIPDFQRAYAQGRNTPQSREIIENFITDVRNALLCSASPLSLDFIYGRKNNGFFEPYDGQQRLTTLFLVHLYILRKTDCALNKNQAWKGFKLSYRTSIEAGRFVEAISDNNNQIFFKQNDTWKLCHLESQLYVDSQMLEDDTVKNMLRTLSVIDEKLGDIKAEEAVKALDNITFSLYENLPDDNPEVFYLKTNTRGLPLTPFENFRSKYESYLKGNNKDTASLSVTRDRMNKYFNWFDSPEDRKLPDEKLMNLFVSYFSSLYSLYGLQEDDSERSMEFVPFQYFATVFENHTVETVMMPLLNLLDFLTEDEERINKLTNEEGNHWYSSKIREAILNNKEPDYLLIVSFFFRVRASFNEEKYKAYIRIVTNLINNNVSINKGNRELWEAISKSDLTEESLLQILDKSDKKNPTISEEAKKLRLIRADSTWRSLIENAESTAFADGFIDYLFDSNNSKEEFELRLKNFKKYFDKKGVQKDFWTLLQTAYISMLPDGCNLYEVEFFNSKRANWRDSIFAHPDIYKDCITNILDDKLCIGVNNDDPNIRELKGWFLNPCNKWFIGAMTENKADEPPFIFRWSYGYPGFKQKNKRQYLLCDLYEKRYTELIRELEKNDDFQLNDICKFKNPNNDKEFVVKPQDSWYDILFSYKEKCYGFSVWGELIKYHQNWNQPTEVVKDFPIFENGHHDSCKTAEQVIAELDKLNNQN